ncbi:hypothetical protein KC367_g273 [Hortaea werneckii]|nr:hypothetical protein KC367_g273 [Hortaea werneckii]
MERRGLGSRRSFADELCAGPEKSRSSASACFRCSNSVGVGVLLNVNRPLEVRKKTIWGETWVNEGRKVILGVRSNSSTSFAGLGDSETLWSWLEAQEPCKLDSAALVSCTKVESDKRGCARAALRSCARQKQPDRRCCWEAGICFALAIAREEVVSVLTSVADLQVLLSTDLLEGFAKRETLKA